MSDLINDLKASIYTGFIDYQNESKEYLQPSLILNDKNKQLKVLTTIKKNLIECEEFFISAAFLRKSGVAVLINTLDELESNNIPGKVLVSEYLFFTEPEALKSLLKFKNIELRITRDKNFHGKEYIFRKGNKYNTIIGSSNLTQDALSTNYEINIQFSALNNSKIQKEIIENFNLIFGTSQKVTNEYILEYEKIFNANKIISFKSSQEVEKEVVEYTPNSMQKDALQNLNEYRERNISKSLIISATGTGKTFLAVFDVKNFNPKRVLFVVHRLNIARKALETFRLIFGNSKKLGIYSGVEKDINADFVFSTVQTINNPIHLKKFNKEDFEYIIIDETHRAGAKTYQSILDYFKPKFLLGMTATPERTDGFDIYSLFDHNVAYEIRLQKALDEELLCPFHYYGVTDLTVNGEILNDTSDFKQLIHEERVQRITEKIEKYGSDNGINRGLIFCSRKEEAVILSDLLNKKNYKTIALTGDNSEEERENAIEMLEEENLEKKLDYIISVDIFNEGIDIPKINQIIMLRPTQSAIIFVQQLGRGLRKVPNKDYLTVIDFIGNYQNNFLVPIALFGDSSFNKDKLRKLLSSEANIIPGCSTINFDKIAKEKIYDSINFSNFNQKKDLIESYRLLKYRLGQIPTMMDFVNTNSRNPYHYVNYSNSYLNFVNDIEDNIHEIPKNFAKLLEYLSKEINNGIRVEESLILKELILSDSTTLDKIKQITLQKYGYSANSITFNSVINNLNLRFATEKYKGNLIPIGEIHNYKIVKFVGNEIYRDDSLKEALSNKIFNDYLSDIANYSIYKFENNFRKDDFVDGFKRYEKYSRKDTLRLLNWPLNMNAQIVSGYKASADKSSCPIFVDYHKKEDIAATHKYEDGFINQFHIKTMSKNRRKIESPDVQLIMNAKKNNTRLPLFIRKSDDEGQEFYYIGNMTPVPEKFEETMMDSGDGFKVSVVNMFFDLDKPVIDELYNYIIEK